MWIARDKNGLLYLHEKKPVKTNYGWYNPKGVTILPTDTFPEIKWEDEEPRELILKPIKKK